jgi:DNA-binding protein Alba
MPQAQPKPQQAQQPTQPSPQPQARAEENVVFVGQKPSMAYVLAVMTQFNSGKGEIRVKARGKSISRAVDVAEIVRRKFLSSLRVKSIRIGTEEHELEDKTTVPVSMIEIVLCR